MSELTDEQNTLAVNIAMSVEEIEAEIERLKTLKQSITPKKERTPRTPKQTNVKKTRKVACSYCGQVDSRSNMERISKYEYQHPMCLYRKPNTVRIEFKI
jgi:hypothetical protein